MSKLGIMENLQWRSKARGVAYFDLVLSSVTLVSVIGHAIYRFAVLGDPGMNTGFYLALICITCIVVFFDIGCAVLLLKATELEADPTYSLKRAMFYRNINIVFIILNAVINLISRLYLQLVCLIFVRGCLLYIVCEFIEELKEARKSPYTHIVA